MIASWNASHAVTLSYEAAVAELWVGAGCDALPHAARTAAVATAIAPSVIALIMVPFPAKAEPALVAKRQRATYIPVNTNDPATPGMSVVWALGAPAVDVGMVGG